MRSPRIVVAVLALALTASMAFTASSASARVDSWPGADAQRSSVSERAAAITVTSRVIKKRLKANRPKQLVFVGKVTPAKGPVYIQKATKCNRDKGTCNFKFYRKVFLKKGAYQAVIDAPPTQRSWLWRAKVKTSFSEVWQTCTKRPKQNCKIPF
ncbi:hypothetical protein [Nocardioides sp.]|uniref:hypothetical protein n=1 Tax=Nocardioides sp. TaxID=35761 RepID=UPI00271CE66C|nr:hypothetical protein [Nocardioides sp.]MDO9457773.1 hypothetical protein [Nocardioides sp.]